VPSLPQSLGNVPSRSPGQRRSHSVPVGFAEGDPPRNENVPWHTSGKFLASIYPEFDHALFPQVKRVLKQSVDRAISSWLLLLKGRLFSRWTPLAFIERRFLRAELLVPPLIPLASLYDVSYHGAAQVEVSRSPHKGAVAVPECRLGRKKSLQAVDLQIDVSVQ
jgi:hypothetical protein